MQTQLSIKTNIAKLKMSKYQGQNILMKVIQKTQIIKNSAIPICMTKILADDEILEGINSLNTKQSGSYMSQRLSKM